MPLSFLRAAKAQKVALTAKALGNALEQRVADLLRTQGSRDIRRNVMLRDAHGNRSEIDVIHGTLFPTYIECKNYASGTPVPLSDVAKFKAVLQLNAIPVQRGLFVTTSTFTPRALTIGVRTVDGQQLIAWEARAKRRAAYHRTAARLMALIAAGCALAYQGADLSEASLIRDTPTALALRQLHERAADASAALHTVLSEALAALLEAAGTKPSSSS